jgi:hypothetical protein
MATGAWVRTVWLTAAIGRSFGGGDDQFDSDPFHLFGEVKRNWLDYDPAVMQAIQDGMDARAGNSNLPYDPSVLQSIQDSGKVA